MTGICLLETFGEIKTVGPKLLALKSLFLPPNVRDRELVQELGEALVHHSGHLSEKLRILWHPCFLTPY